MSKKPIAQREPMGPPCSPLKACYVNDIKQLGTQAAAHQLHLVLLSLERNPSLCKKGHDSLREFIGYLNDYTRSSDAKPTLIKQCLATLKAMQPRPLNKSTRTTHLISNIKTLMKALSNHQQQHSSTQQANRALCGIIVQLCIYRRTLLEIMASIRALKAHNRGVLSLRLSFIGLATKDKFELHDRQALTLIVSGLYAMQRGKNLSRTLIDNEQADAPPSLTKKFKLIKHIERACQTTSAQLKLKRQYAFYGRNMFMQMQRCSNAPSSKTPNGF